MLSEKRPPIRNRIDIDDAMQVRVLKKRLGVSATELRQLTEKVGVSIAAVTKEVETQKVVSDSASTDSASTA